MTNFHHLPTTSSTLVLIDPSSPQGEAGVEALDQLDEAVVLVMPLYGRRAAALRDFAKSEDIDVATAGNIYLDQVAGRIDTDKHTLTMLPTDGLDLVADVVAVAKQLPSLRRIIVPASLAATVISLNRLSAQTTASLSVTAA